MKENNKTIVRVPTEMVQLRGASGKPILKVCESSEHPCFIDIEIPKGPSASPGGVIITIDPHILKRAVEVFL